MSKKTTFGEALCEAHHYLLSKYPKVFCIGQGLWAPWYVGNSMKDLDKTFGRERIIDSPVSEAACTGAALGASLFGYRPIVVHPRMDFMILAIDQIVTQAANWSHMFGGQAHPAVTIRGIINRGGEQGAQHSQALHSWFAHVPGLRVVMPATPQDARDLFIASVLSDDPVLFIDDRWLYDLSDELPEIKEVDLREQKPKILREGKDITLVGVGYSTKLCLDSSELLAKHGIEAEVIDLRVLNPLCSKLIEKSVAKTGTLIAADVGWKNCGIAAEVLARVSENVPLAKLKCNPVRITIANTPAPTSRELEKAFFFTAEDIALEARALLETNRTGQKKVENA